MIGTSVLAGIHSSNFLWTAVVWTLGYGVLLSVLVAGRSARTM